MSSDVFARAILVRVYARDSPTHLVQVFAILPELWEIHRGEALSCMYSMHDRRERGFVRERCMAVCTYASTFLCTYAPMQLLLPPQVVGRSYLPYVVSNCFVFRRVGSLALGLELLGF